MLRIVAALFLGLTTASAAVVERVTPLLPSAPVPALTFSMSGPMSASFTPALTGVMNAPSLATPSPIILPVFAAPAADLKPAGILAAAPALHPLSAPSAERHERGPPDARAAGFSTLVSKSVADTVRDWVVPSEELLDDHDALIVGENHESLASVNELTRALPGLAKAGVSVLGIEGLKRHSQRAVDGYLQGDALPQEVLSFSPRRRAAFEALLASARKTGVRVVALGLPLDQWASQAAELAAKKTGEPVESFLRSPGEQLYRAQTSYEPGYNEAVAEVYLTRRNKNMAAFLAGAMAAGAKAVALVGQNHIDGADAPKLMHIGPIARWGTLGRELASLGLRAFSLTLTGGLFLDADGAKGDRDMRRASYEKASTLSPDGSPVYMRTGESTGLYHAGGRVPGSMTAH